MSLQNSFENVKRENLNFDSLVFYLGSCIDVETLTENLQNIYVTYTKALFLCNEPELIATNKEIYELLFELDAVISIFKDMQKPNGQIKISM